MLLKINTMFVNRKLKKDGEKGGGGGGGGGG